MNEEAKHEIEWLEKQRDWHKDEIADNEANIENHKSDIRDIDQQIAALREKADITT